MIVTKEIVIKAIEKAAEGHSDNKAVERMLANEDAYAESVIASIKSGEYKKYLGFRKLTKKMPTAK